MLGRLLITGMTATAIAMLATEAWATPDTPDTTETPEAPDAADVPYAPYTPRGPCPHLRTEAQCLAYPTGECFWDYTDYRCETREPQHDPVCGYIYDANQCAFTPECFWDQTDFRCERR